MTMCSTCVRGEDATGNEIVEGVSGRMVATRTHQKGPSRASADLHRTGRDNHHHRIRSGKGVRGEGFDGCMLKSDSRPRRFEDSRDGSGTF